MEGLNETLQKELDRLVDKDLEELTEQDQLRIMELLWIGGAPQEEIKRMEKMLGLPTDKDTEANDDTQTVSGVVNERKRRRRRNAELKGNIGKIADSEAEKKQLNDILNKKQKSKSDNRILDAALERLRNPTKPVDVSANLRSESIPSGDPEVPPNLRSNERAEGSPAGAPLVKLQVKNRKKEPLPKLEYPSTTIVLAKKFSGKTNLLLNIVDKNNFDNIWVVSLTGFTGKLDALCEDEDCLLEDISDEMINEVLKMHKEDRMKSLIIFDDVIGQVDMRSKGMVKLATMGRNFGISIIISSQDFFRVPPVWRRNTEYWYLGAMMDSNIDGVAKELATPTFQKKRIKQELSNVARDKNHDWLFYNDRKTNFRKLFGTQFKVIV